MRYAMACDTPHPEMVEAPLFSVYRFSDSRGNACDGYYSRAHVGIKLRYRIRSVLDVPVTRQGFISGPVLNN